MAKSALWAIPLLALSSCAIHIEKEARLYDTQAGTVLPAMFVWEGKPHGRITATLADGSRCAGEYSTIQRPTEGWGLIYGMAGASLASSNAARGNKGAAIVVCEDKRTIECEYLTSGYTTGNGYCKDNRGASYRLMF